jgi:hypothetical protein
VALLQEPLAQVEANETGRTGDEDHGFCVGLFTGRSLILTIEDLECTVIFPVNLEK